MNMKVTPSPLKPELVQALVGSVPPGKYSSNDGTYQISVYGTEVSCLKLRATLTDPSELRSWEYEKGTGTLIFDWGSGRTTRFTRTLAPDIQIGASSTESPTVSESYPQNGLKSSDPINPSHYQNKEGVDIITFTESVGFNRGNAIKYLYRAGKKSPDKLLEDLEKASWYVTREIKRIKNASPNTTSGH